MKTYLLIKSLFKTVEYKLVNSDSLEVTELSMSGAKSKKVLLSSINIEEGQSIPTFVSLLVLFLGLALIATTFYLSQFSVLLEKNIMNAVVFLLTITASLLYLCKPIKTHNYRDVYSNTVLLKMNAYIAKNSSTDEFMTHLNSAIAILKDEESNKINLKKNAKLQYEIHNKNVDDLFNLGLIDEVLYNRICSSMHEKVFGNLTNRVISDNVVYLNR